MLVKARGVDPAENRGFAPVRLIFGRILRRRQIAVGQARHKRIRLLGGAGALFLLFHQCLETVEVHQQAPLLGHELRQVDGEAVGVVELEGVVAADGLGGSLGRTVGGGGEELQTPVERPAEADFLGLNHGRDILGPLAHFGEGLAQAVHDHGDQFIQEGLVQIELAAEAPRPGGESGAGHSPGPRWTGSRRR